jgi:hypothetical protein
MRPEMSKPPRVEAMKTTPTPRRSQRHGLIARLAAM